MTSFILLRAWKLRECQLQIRYEKQWIVTESAVASMRAGNDTTASADGGERVTIRPDECSCAYVTCASVLIGDMLQMLEQHFVIGCIERFATGTFIAVVDRKAFGPYARPAVECVHDQPGIIGDCWFTRQSREVVAFGDRVF